MIASLVFFKNLKKETVRKKNFCVKRTAVLVDEPILREYTSRWYIEYYIEHVGCVRQRMKLTGFNHIKDLDERRAMAYSLIEKLKQDYTAYQSKTKRCPVKEALIFYYKSNIHTWEITTQNKYRGMINMFCQWLVANNIYAEPAALKLEDISPFFKQMIDKGRSAVTHNNYLFFLSGVYKAWLLDDMHGINKNPFMRVKSMKMNKVPKRAFTPRQIELLKPELHTAAWLYYRFIYYTFLRPNEIRYLKINEIDRDKRQVIVLGENAKPGLQRIHQIPDVLMDELVAHKVFSQSKNSYLFGSGKLFSATPSAKNYYYSYLATQLLKLKFDTTLYSVYSWRHTGASQLYIQTKDVKLVQRAMQHTSVAQTESYLKSIGAYEDERLFNRPAI